LFARDGQVVAMSEGPDNAAKEEAYQSKVSNDCEMYSILGPTYDACWDLTRYRGLWVHVIK